MSSLTRIKQPGVGKSEPTSAPLVASLASALLYFPNLCSVNTSPGGKSFIQINIPIRLGNSFCHRLGSPHSSG